MIPIVEDSLRIRGYRFGSWFATMQFLKSAIDCMSFTVEEANILMNAIILYRMHMSDKINYNEMTDVMQERFNHLIIATQYVEDNWFRDTDKYSIPYCHDPHGIKNKNI